MLMYHSSFINQNQIGFSFDFCRCCCCFLPIKLATNDERTEIKTTAGHPFQKQYMHNAQFKCEQRKEKIIANITRRIQIHNEWCIFCFLNSHYTYIYIVNVSGYGSFNERKTIFNDHHLRQWKIVSFLERNRQREPKWFTCFHSSKSKYDGKQFSGRNTIHQIAVAIKGSDIRRMIVMGRFIVYDDFPNAMRFNCLRYPYINSNNREFEISYLFPALGTILQRS